MFLLIVQLQYFRLVFHPPPLAQPRPTADASVSYGTLLDRNALLSKVAFRHSEGVTPLQRRKASSNAEWAE